MNKKLQEAYERELAHVQGKLKEWRDLQSPKDPPKPVHWFWRLLETLRAYSVNEEPRL